MTATLYILIFSIYLTLALYAVTTMLYYFKQSNSAFVKAMAISTMVAIVITLTVITVMVTIIGDLSNLSNLINR